MAVADRGTAAERRVIGNLLDSGWFEAVPSALLLLLAVVFNRTVDHPWQPLALDAATFLAAALTARFPKAAGIALAVCLGVALTLPKGWGTLGEYAAVIPILGTGMRSLRAARLTMTIGYGTLLGLITVQDAPNVAGAILGCLAWLVLLAVVWLIGNAFVTVTRAHELQRATELLLERQRLARQLHDTVARSLTMMARLAARMQRRESVSDAELETLADTAQHAQEQLRLAMMYLSDPTNPAAQLVPGSSTFSEALRAGRLLLEQHGFRPSVGIEGDVEQLPPQHSAALADAAAEVFANVVKHGDPSGPVAIGVFVTPAQAELDVVNHVREAPVTAGGPALGLSGIRQRVADAGGTVSAGPLDSQWQTRIVMPFDQADRRL